MPSFLQTRFTYIWGKLHTKNSFTRRVTGTVAVQFLGLAISIGVGAITARWLGPTGRGIYQLAILYPGMLSLLLSGGLSGANVYYTGAKRFDVATLTATSSAVAIVGTIVGALLTGLGIWLGWFDRWLPGLPAWLIVFGYLTLPLSLLQLYYRSILHGLQQIHRVNLLLLWQSITTLLFTIVGVIILPGDLFGAMAAYTLSLLVILGVTMRWLGQAGGTFRPQWKQAVLREMFTYSMRGYIANLLQFYNYRLDNFVVNFYLGPAQVGIYGVSVRFAELLLRFPEAVGFVIFPKAAATTAHQMNRITPRVFRLTLIITAVGALALALMAKPLIRFVYSAEFEAAYWPLLVILPGIVLLGASKVLSNEIAGRGYPQYNSISAAISVIFTVGLDIALIPRWGIVGASAASTVAYIATFFSTIFFYYRVSSLPAEANQVDKTIASIN